MVAKVFPPLTDKTIEWRNEDDSRLPEVME
jgi:hypothetical protein